MTGYEFLMFCTEQGTLYGSYALSFITQTAASFKTGDFQSQPAMMKMLTLTGGVWWVKTKLTHKQREARISLANRWKDNGWPPQGRLTITGDKYVS